MRPIAIDIRERLTSIAKIPSMCAIVREGLLVQIMLWLLVAGVDGDSIRSLERVGISQSTPSSAVDVEHLTTRVGVPTDPWATEVVNKALAMLPNPCVVGLQHHA